MNSFKNVKAHQLYVNKPLFKTLMIIIVPTLLMTLMTGVYYFVNQVIIVKLIPFAHGNATDNFYYWFKMDYSQIKQLVHENGLNFYDVTDVVRGAVSISSPISTIVGTSPFFIAGGATVLFTQSLGRGNKLKAQEVIKTSFYIVLFLSLLEMGVLIAINQPLLKLISSPIEHTNNATLNEYYQKVHDIEIRVATQLTIIYVGCLIVPMLAFYLASLIKSEGHFKFVAIVSVVCNIMNVGLTSLLVLVVKTDAYSAPISTIICHSINLICLLIYLTYLNKQNKTWLEFNVILKMKYSKFRINLINPIILVGLSAFLIDVSFSIANIVFIPVLANVAANTNIFPQANGNGMYFQTIEGAVMPVLTLIFIAIYGVMDGGRIVIAYNYPIGNYKRIKKTFWCLIYISFGVAIILLSILSLGLGYPILHLFNIPKDMMHNAYLVLILENAMIIIFCFQASAMSIYMAIGDIIKSNISAIFQDVITFFPVLGICVGLTYLTNDIWILVACYVINALIATTLMMIYTTWWLKNRLGKTILKICVNDKSYKMWVPITNPIQSYVQMALEII